MRDLRFVGLDEAGDKLVFVDEDDQEFAAVVDSEVVDATRRAHGWHGRTAAPGTTGSDRQADSQVDTTMQELRPREIQARVRAGEAPEALAEAAGVDVERVVRFARPVLQEREHVAIAAQQVVVRTGALDGPLGEVVEDRLAHVVTEFEPTWDAWRREDGRWTVSLTFRDDVQQRVARWSFDPTTNSVIVDDEVARWLTEGTSAPAPTAPSRPAAEPRATGGRRLLSVPDLAPAPEPVADAAYDEVEIADELAALGLQPVADDAPAEPEVETVAVVEVVEVIEVIAPVEAAPVAPVEDEQTAFDISTTEPVAPPAAETAPAKKRKTAKRASVPSWDDIVFGARKPSE